MELPTIDDLVALVESRAADRPAAERLQLAIEVGREIADLGDALIGRFVAEARAAGLSWTEIGLLFGTTKQAVQQRYGSAPTTDRLGPWSAEARSAVDRAAWEARGLGHQHVGTEHALLVLASAEQDMAADVLAGLGVTRGRILGTSCMTAGPHRHEPSAVLPLMPRLKQALEHSRRIADGLGVPAAGTEHLLAGLVAVPDSMAVEILRRLKVRPDAVRGALGERLGVDPERLAAPRRRRRRRLVPAR